MKPLVTIEANMDDDSLRAAASQEDASGVFSIECSTSSSVIQDNIAGLDNFNKAWAALEARIQVSN